MEDTLQFPRCKTICLPIKPATVGEAPISRACFEIIGTVMLTPSKSCSVPQNQECVSELTMLQVTHLYI